MWNQTKVQEFIDNEIEENINLDYKASDSLGKSDGKKKEISKDVSAFANSAGGRIIYGIAEYNQFEKSHLPEKIDPVNRISFTKEWLEQVINSNVSPKIEGLRIFSSTIGDVGNNEVVYIVEIPQSNTAHQAKDRKYYKRYNFESVAMEDYEIKDIINRINKTDIQIRLIEKPSIKTFKERYELGERFKISTAVWAFNNGNVAANNLQLFLKGNEEFSSFILAPKMEKINDYQIYFSNANERKANIGGQEIVINIDRKPVLPGTSLKIGELEFYSDIIFKGYEVDFLISTEDRFKNVKIKGIEIMGSMI